MDNAAARERIDTSRINGQRAGFTVPSFVSSILVVACTVRTVPFSILTFFPSCVFSVAFTYLDISWPNVFESLDCIWCVVPSNLAISRCWSEIFVHNPTSIYINNLCLMQWYRSRPCLWNQASRGWDKLLAPGISDKNESVNKYTCLYLLQGDLCMGPQPRCSSKSPVLVLQVLQ